MTRHFQTIWVLQTIKQYNHLDDNLYRELELILEHTGEELPCLIWPLVHIICRKEDACLHTNTCMWCAYGVQVACACTWCVADHKGDANADSQINLQRILIARL